jgi:hypothetical protein
MGQDRDRNLDFLLIFIARDFSIHVWWGNNDPGKGGITTNEFIEKLDETIFQIVPSLNEVFDLLEKMIRFINEQIILIHFSNTSEDEEAAEID